jgi:hypothetical protein
MKKQFLIFSRSGDGHSVVELVRARSPLEAIQRLMKEQKDHLIFCQDGSVVMPYGRRKIHYPHPLAYIEANEKVHGEWQIREVPEWVWSSDYEEAFCGEDASDIEWCLKFCRPVLRQELPRSRAPGFVWYLRDGALVTFYRRTRSFEIEVLRRYLIAKSARRGMKANGTLVSRWTGGYPELLDQLYLVRYGWDSSGAERSGES